MKTVGRRTQMAISLAGLLAGGHQAWAQAGDGGAQQLIQQGSYWHAHGRDDLAQDAWNRLLLVDPAQPDALLGLGEIAINRGDADTARQRLQQLQRIHPGAAQTAQLRLDVGGNDSALSSARMSAARGDYAQAIASYRRFFGGPTPPANLALEYYQVLAGAPGEAWAQAVAGLRSLQQGQPDNAATALALARVLTYREPSRREGIDRLAEWSARHGHPDEARAPWRQALLWLGSWQGDDADRFHRYMTIYPTDHLVLEQSERLRKQSAQAGDAHAGVELAAAFHLLDQHRSVQAQAAFSQLLRQHPGDSQAMGGLGTALLQQEQFESARRWLQKAAAASPRWRGPLESADYWSALRQAQALVPQHPEQALAGLRQLTRQQPSNPAGWVALGQLLLAQGDTDGAADACQRALKLDPANPGARQALIQVYIRQGHAGQATKLFGQLNADQQKRMGGLDRLQAEEARQQAASAVAGGDMVAARDLLQKGLDADPGNVWLNLDLARLYLHADRPVDARTVMDRLLLRAPDSVDAIYASALLSADEGDWAAVYASLRRMAPDQRSDEAAALLRRAAIRLEIARAVALARQGRFAEARQTLMQLEPGVSTGPGDLLAAVATGYADIGDTARASQLATRLLESGQPQPSVELRLQYASVLLSARQDAPLLLVLRQLQSAPMDAAQAQQYADLREGYALRQVELYRQMGNLEQAYAVLSPLLQHDGQAVKPLQALARLYVSAGKSDDALQIYRRVLQLQPDDVDTLLAAAGAAEQIHDYAAASGFVDAALSQTPHSPRVLADAARLYRARGDSRRAAAYFRQALDEQAQALADSQAGMALPALAAPAAAPAAGMNPFAGITGSGEEPEAGDGLPLPALASAAASLRTASDSSQQIAADAGMASVPAAAGGYDVQATDTVAGASVPAAMNSSALAASVRAGGGADGFGADRRLPGQGLLAAADRHLHRLSPVNGDDSREDLVAELQSVQADASDSLSAGMVYRNRNGSGGLGKLDDLELPLQGRFSVGQGRITASITPTLLDAGTASTSYDSASQFGGGPAAALDGAIAANATAVSGLLDSTLFQGLLTQGNGNATRNLIYQTALSNGEYQTLFNQTDYSASYADRTAAAMSALFNLPLASYMLNNDLSATPLKTIAQQILANSSYSGALSSAQLATLQSLAGSALGALTPTQFAARLQSMSAAGAGARRLGPQDARGAGVGAAYDLGGLHFDVGSTPLGFPESRLVGGLAYHGQIGEDVNFTVQGSRRAVSDSLLSFAGVEDPRTGQRWGGVTANGGRFQIGRDNGAAGFYGYGSYAVLVGTHVQQNNRGEAGGGAYLHLISGPDQSLTAGLNVTYMQYSHNLQGFTYGQGGYFSPQRYVNIGVPIHWSGRKGAWNWMLDASIGVQSFHQNASNYFPTDPALQAQAYQAASIASTLGLASYTDPVYRAQSKTGLGYNLDGAVEYQVAPKLYLGGRIELNNASNYQQLSSGLYLRYQFDDFGGTVKPQPTPLLSPYSPAAGE